MANAVGSGFDGVRLWITNAVDSIGAFFTPITDKLTNIFTSVTDFFTSMVSWIDPLSDKFFLKVAFVPDEVFMTAWYGKIDSLMNGKFSSLTQFKTSLEGFRDTLNSSVPNFSPIKIDLTNYGVGSLSIIDSSALVEYGEKLRFWLGGFIVLLTGAFLVRKLSGVLGEGK